ncbi:MAG TPA: hypothetical protein VG296_12985 [Actinospica sp.]|nr:hypothetical protein [Actinospica sp.]
MLAAFYCRGLDLPFLITAVAFGWAMRAVGWIKRHYTLRPGSAAACSPDRPGPGHRRVAAPDR